ncbi:MAG TPA: hypothetical protein VFP87_05930 [Chitinophagaceae bacterium]|nr:hypothetical protein [Chitinophagaceae bacterium]
MRLFLVLVFAFITLTTTAQNKTAFSSQNYVGLLEGEQGSRFQLQAINGIKYNNWFAGLGTGIDWYYLRSIPLFLSVNRNFLKNGNRNFFVAGDAGVNFPWRVDKDNMQGYTIEKSIPGIYWGVGLGYKIGVGKTNDAILVQLGYSYKHVTEKAKTTYYYYYYYINRPIGDPRPDMTNQFDYYLRRLSLKLGWNF